MEKTIRIFAKEVELDNGISFLKFSYTKDGKVFYDVKFNKTSEWRPDSQGYWLITVDTVDVNVQKTKKIEIKNKTFKPNDIIWIKKVSKGSKDTNHEEDQKQVKAEAINELLSK